MRLLVRFMLVAAALLLPADGAGACADLTRAPSTRWRIETRRGISWLRTPCGDRFFTIGINALNAGLPARELGGRVGYHWDGLYPDFPAWLEATRSRVRTWGFNTAGATSLAPAVLALPAIPDLQLGLSASFHWVDPFDPAAEDRLRRTARRLVGPYKGTPLRIGYFTDNESGWWSGALFGFYLARPATNHTKARLVALLREHYSGVWTRFTRDFIPPPGVSSFAGLLRSTGRTPYLRAGGAGMQVVRRWTGVVAERYYRLVRRAMRAADPEALLFGDRLPIYYDPAAVRAMAPYVDAIATNYNVDSPDGWIARYYFDGLRRLSGGKPVLVSEWFFAADENRTGNRNNGHLMAVPTQAERARGAAAAAEAFAREAGIVGLHWFQYYDHPQGGRPDGEDYNFGLVDVGDRPYEELTTAFSRVNPRLAAIHADARGTPPARTEIPAAQVDPADRSLADWPKERALLAPATAPAPEIPFGDFYVAWDRDGLHLALIAMDYSAPELIPPGRELPLEETFHVDWGVDAGHGPRHFALYIVPPAPGSGTGHYVMRAELCRIEAGRCAAVPSGVATYFGADQPRITAEVRIPWAALGVDGPPSEGLRMELAATGFHRARWMSWSGRSPAAALGDPSRWRHLRLGSAG